MSNFESGGSLEDGEHDESDQPEDGGTSLDDGRRESTVLPEIRSSDKAIDLASAGKYQTLEDRREKLIEEGVFSSQDFDLLMISALNHAIDNTLASVGQISRQLDAIQRVIPDVHTEGGGRYELEQLVLVLTSKREEIAKGLKVKDEDWEATIRRVRQTIENPPAESDPTAF